MAGILLPILCGAEVERKPARINSLHPACNLGQARRSLRRPVESSGADRCSAFPTVSCLKRPARPGTRRSEPSTVPGQASRRGTTLESRNDKIDVTGQLLPSTALLQTGSNVR